MSHRNEPIRVGVAGLGRSGWSIHVNGFRQMSEHYRVTAVMDLDAGRRREAEESLGCQSYDTFDALIADDDVELVVVATPNRLHTRHAIAAMDAGKDVVVEKPLALSLEDADQMIAASDRTGRVLAPFQNRRYEAHFQKVREVVASGVLGDLVQVRIAHHGFGRRWDWQTLQEFGGGQLNNWGPHLIDHAIQFLGEGDLCLFADLRNGLSSGDAEDHVKIVMKAQTGPMVEVEITSLAAKGQDRWLVMGTGGGLRGTTSRLEWSWVDWDAMPDRPVERVPTADRSYNREDLPWQEGHWEGGNHEDELRERFYVDLFQCIRERAPLVVKPTEVRRQIEIMTRCRETCPVVQLRPVGKL